MKLLPLRLFALGCAVGIVSLTVACGSKSGTPVSPITPTPPVVTPTISAPTPRSPIGGQQLDTLKPTLSVTNAVATGNVGAVAYEFQLSELDSFPVGSRTATANDIQQGSDGATNWIPPSNTIPNLLHFWRARATAASVATPSDWSKTETFRSQTKGFTIFNQEVYDPLTDGSTVGDRIGGHFVAGQGWQADGETNAIYYNFGACTSCTMEFDVTNFGRAVGASASKDYKWVTMADAATFGDFFAFREDPWKMHLEQRSDGDGTGMKLIWRNGAGGGGNPGDHENRNDSTVDWKSNVVYHFTLRWSPAGFTLRVGTVNTDGTVSGDREWFSGSFGGQAYAPPSLRISLGCYPRSETMTGAIWRNVHIVKN